MRHIKLSIVAAMVLATSVAFAGDYPIQVNSRPLTLGGGMTEAQLGVSTVNKVGDDMLGLDIGVNRAIDDKLQVGLATSMGIKPEAKWSEMLALGVAYSVKDEAALDIAPGLWLPLNLGEGDVYNGFIINGTTRYTVNERIAVTVGNGLVSLIKFGDENMIDANINLGVGVQLANNMNLGINAGLGNIALAGEFNETALAEAVPVSVDFRFSTDSSMDVGLSADLGDVKDFNADNLLVNLVAAKRF